MTTKYQPLFELDKMVQLTYSTQGKAIFYSQVHLAKDDNVEEDEAGGWVLSAFTGKSYFEREYRREDLDDLVRIEQKNCSISQFAQLLRLTSLSTYEPPSCILALFIYLLVIMYYINSAGV